MQNSSNDATLKCTNEQINADRGPASQRLVLVDLGYKLGYSANRP